MFENLYPVPLLLHILFALVYALWLFFRAVSQSRLKIKVVWNAVAIQFKVIL